MTAEVAVRPKLLSIGIEASLAGFVCALEHSKRTCELGNFLQGCDQFGIGGGEPSRESAIILSERCHRGATTGSGNGQFGGTYTMNGI